MRLALAVVFFLVTLGLLAAAVVLSVKGEYLAAVLCLPTAAGTGFMFVRDVRALLK